MVKLEGKRRSGRVRRHLRWAVPLILGVLAYVVFIWWAAAISSSVDPNDPADAAASLAVVALGGLAFLLAFIALVFFVVGAVRALVEWRRDRRHATGRYNRAELADRAQQEHFGRAWEATAHLRATLAAHQVPPQIRVWDVVPRPNEAFFLDTGATYARFYGQDVSYSQSGGFFFGHPLFVAAGLAVTAAGNAARRSAAEAAAAAQWREHQNVRLIVSNQRLICQVGGHWLSFDYGAMTAVYPEVQQWSLVCQFDSAEPLMLHGPGVPAAAVITVLMTYGPDAVAEHPSLAPLGR